jgi:hypothetical protein
MATKTVPFITTGLLYRLDIPSFFTNSDMPSILLFGVTGLVGCEYDVSIPSTLSNFLASPSDPCLEKTILRLSCYCIPA